MVGLDQVVNTYKSTVDTSKESQSFSLFSCLSLHKLLFSLDFDSPESALSKVTNSSHNN